MDTACLSSQQNLDDFVRAFENSTIPKSQWDHRAHIVVAAYYAEQYGLASTLEKLRTGISVLNSKHGIDNTATSGYHETITVFWASVIATFLCRLAPTPRCLEKVNLAAARFATQRDLWRDFYTYDLTKSPEARKEWRAPDIWLQTTNRSGSNVR